MHIPVISKDPDFPYIIEIHFEKTRNVVPESEPVPEPGQASESEPAPKHHHKIIQILLIGILIEAIVLGAVAWRVLIKPKPPAEEPVPLGTPEETEEVPPAPAATQTSGPSEETPKTQELAKEPLISRSADIAVAFDDLKNYVQSTGLDMSFGYVDLTTGYTYKYQGDRVYYGASLVKTLDAMYAYEKLGTFDWHINALIINAATYSKNDAHASLVEELGIENLRKYGEEIGMKHHLKPSSIYPNTYYFCDTTVDDQIAEWQHLWYLYNNLEMGWELGEHFRIGWWGVLSFPGHPQFMFKAGFYGPYYNETGIFLSDKPYIFTLLTTNGYRADKDYIMSDLSRRVYEINQSY